MPSRKLTEKELRDKQVASKTKKFIGAVEEFLKSKNGGAIPSEWLCSLEMLTAYYRQFIQLTEDIDALPSLVVNTRYGAAPSPLLTARDKTAVRLESLLKQMGLTFKSAAGLDVIEPVKTSSPLEEFVKAKMEKNNK